MSDQHHILFVASGVAFIATSAIGILGAIQIAQPGVIPEFIPFEVLRPIHTFLAISAVLVGLQGLVFAVIGRHMSQSWFWIYAAALTMFVTGGVIALSTGHGTGREYFSWPLLVSAPLFAAFMMFLWKVFQAGRQLERRSPEGFWLIGFGGVFILTGLLESQLWRLSSIGSNFVQDLTIQWHGIDTFFAGVNTVLYGCGIFLLGGAPKPLRSKVLFVIAGLSLLFTFGHHHYISPQPNFLKTLAFIASMLAMVSFWRHVTAYRKLPKTMAARSYAAPLWRTVQLWTIVSIATGILFAIPQVNLIVHGTYLVLIHAMGSMIGVNFMIIIVGGLVLGANRQQIRSARVRWGVRFVNFALIGLWLVLGIAGFIKGVIRIDGDYYDYQPMREVALYGFPIVGVVLLAGVTLLSNEMIRANLVMRRKEGIVVSQIIAFLSKLVHPVGRLRNLSLFEFGSGKKNCASGRANAELLAEQEQGGKNASRY